MSQGIQDGDKMSAREKSVRHLELLTALDNFQEYELQVGRLIDDSTVRTCLELLSAAVRESFRLLNADALHQRADEGDAERAR